ncbi:MAG: hypothetical protein FWH48_00340 [Oscillospiraceae bacterium]|nr:hypothetical protein [Oscillospiraceae bacterium]
MKTAKRFMAFTFIAVLLLSLFPISVAAADPKTTQAIKGTPAMMDDEGNIDPIWDFANEIEAKLINQTFFPDRESTTWGKIKTMWDENYLYLFAEVNKEGKQVWNTGGVGEHVDAIEFDIDEANDKTGEGNVPGGNPAAGVFRVGTDDSAISGFGDMFADQENDVKGKTVINPDGTSYKAQMAIPWNTLAPQEGTIIGFEVQINESDEGAGRSGVATWNDIDCMGWSDTAAMGNLILVAAPVIETIADETEAPDETPEEIPVIQEPENIPAVVSSPQTGDWHISILLVLILGSLVAVAVFKLRLRRIK